MSSFGLDGVRKRSGTNVAYIRLALFGSVLAFSLFSSQARTQELRDPQPGFASVQDGRTLTCSQPERLRISEPFVRRAKLKLRLYNLLRESLHDDATGIVNIAREKEIKDLANKLKHETDR